VRSEYQALGLPTDERGFFDTQDRIAWSGQGLPRITGRQDDTIIRAGINIYPDEIECHVGSIEGVNAFCLVGLPSSTYGQVPVLACEVDDAQDHETIRSALMEKLAASLPESHVPARIHFSTHLPKTALGKLQRKRVAEQIAKEDRGG
jgi:acyl-CoA synthetase (AMP-forming)/AMP-acid ligase II